MCLQLSFVISNNLVYVFNVLTMFVLRFKTWSTFKCSNNAVGYPAKTYKKFTARLKQLIAMSLAAETVRHLTMGNPAHQAPLVQTNEQAIKTLPVLSGRFAPLHYDFVNILDKTS